MRMRGVVWCGGGGLIVVVPEIGVYVHSCVIQDTIVHTVQRYTVGVESNNEQQTACWR